MQYNYIMEPHLLCRALRALPRTQLALTDSALHYYTEVILFLLQRIADGLRVKIFVPDIASIYVLIDFYGVLLGASTAAHQVESHISNSDF